MSHSKRNTSLAFFTSHERSQLQGWGSQSARISSDQTLPFGSCSLCLMPAKDPVACNGFESSNSKPTAVQEQQAPMSKAHAIGGLCHMFCRECALSSILAQKQDFKRQHHTLSAQRAQDALQKADKEARAEARAIEDFEKLQSGYVPKTSSDASRDVANHGGNRKRAHPDTGRDERQEKRIATETFEKIEDFEKKRGQGPFWMPSVSKAHDAPPALSPAGRSKGDKKSAVTLCPGSQDVQHQHPLTLKTLVPINFSLEDSTRTCPSCSRPLNNSTRPILSRPCGHVVCRNCCEQFVLGHANEGANDVHDTIETICFVCSASLTDSTPQVGTKPTLKSNDPPVKRGLIEISCETRKVVEKKGIAFAFG